MSDIVERLEHYAKTAMPNYPDDLCSEAAAEIRRLRAAAQTVPKTECEYCKKWHDPRLACPEYAALSSTQRNEDQS